MDICINELSLTGQYASKEDCVDRGISPMVGVIRRLEESCDIVLYKHTSLYQRMATNSDTLHALLTGNFSREKDEIRKFKLLLAKLFTDPYWENSPKHSFIDVYLMSGKNVTGSSLAESCERDRSIISFIHDEFKDISIIVMKNATEQIELDNFFYEQNCIGVMWQRGNMSFEKYICCKYRGSKLNFSQIDPGDGFNLLTVENETLFEDAFRLFDQLSWTQIIVSDGLDYKEYTNKQKEKIAIFKSKKIYKFRITRKYRCFGHVENGVFYVLMFDLTHKLSD